MDDFVDTPTWSEFTDMKQVRQTYRAVAEAIRTRKVDLGISQYALPLLMGVIETICCGGNKLTAVEMGVATGKGLLSLCKAAAFFRDRMGMDIRVVGLDNASGLPPAQSYMDHPELWSRGNFKMPDSDELRAKLPAFADLLIGDIADTGRLLRRTLEEHPLGFMAIDVDLYSSTKSCLGTLVWQPECYLPAVPMYFDDLETFITNSDWSGEGLAIAEFNTAMASRKLQRHRESSVPRFYTAQVLDHPLRTGSRHPRFPLLFNVV